MIYSAEFDEKRMNWEVVAWRTMPNGSRVGMVMDKVATQEAAEEIASTYNDETATAD